MLPDKTTKCHRTGFTKSCFECVTEHGCRLWKRVQLEHDPRNGAVLSEHYDCVDSLVDLYMHDMLRRQSQTVSTVDKLSNEVKQANDAGMANALMGINREIRRQNGLIENAAPAPKLIES